jgi:hypothetical protein
MRNFNEQQLFQVYFFHHHYYVIPPDSIRSSKTYQIFAQIVDIILIREIKKKHNFFFVFCLSHRKGI